MKPRICHWFTQKSWEWTAFAEGGKQTPFSFLKVWEFSLVGPFGYGYGTLYLIQNSTKNLCLYHKLQIHQRDVWEQFLKEFFKKKGLWLRIKFGNFVFCLWTKKNFHLLCIGTHLISNPSIIPEPSRFSKCKLCSILAFFILFFLQSCFFNARSCNNLQPSF